MVTLIVIDLLAVAVALSDFLSYKIHNSLLHSAHSPLYCNKNNSERYDEIHIHVPNAVIL